MTSGIEFGVPDRFAGAFKDRLSQRVSELVSDLALDPSPACSWTGGTTGVTLSVDGQPLPIELSVHQTSSRTLDDSAEAVAEGVARSLVRYRWKLLASALAAHKVPSRPVLEHVAAGGASLPQLLALHEAEPNDDDELAFLAAERHSPSVTLLLPRAEIERVDDVSWLAGAAQTVAAYFGMPVPVPEIALDLWLDSGQFRLRVGSVRSGVQPEPWNSQTRDYQLQRVLRRNAAGLFDVGSLLTLLSDPARVLPDRTRATLAKVTAPELTWALRELLRTGIGLVDPLQICEAVTQPAVQLKTWGHGILAPPGVLVLPPRTSEASDLDLRLRARLAPAHLLRWIVAEGGGQLSPRVILLGEATRNCLRERDLPPGWTIRLAQAIAEQVSGPLDVLSTPADLGAPLRKLLADLLPDLLVVSPEELPQNAKPILRKLIEIGADP